MPPSGITSTRCGSGWVTLAPHWSPSALPMIGSAVETSTRSRLTGPGSRGGQPLDPAYWRRWRAEHPEYRAREVERSRQRKAAARLDRDRAATDALIAEEDWREIEQRQTDEWCFRRSDEG